jgi:hypothetical protein
MIGSAHKVLLVCSALWASALVAAAESEADADVEVRRLDGDSAGWSVAETASFRVYHRENVDLARKAARAAEKTRSAIYRKWFGKVAPDWTPRCEVFLHANGEEYYQGTGFSTRQRPGFSTMATDAGRIVSRRMDLNAANPDLLKAVLPHEVAHIVIWSWFGNGGFPQWINEGMAVLTEPRDRVERHLRNLPRHRKRGELLPIKRLVESRNYPEPRSLGPFYAQSVSLVDFLTAAKDAKTFTRFVHDGIHQDYDTACRRHYGWSLEEMEERWWRHAFGTEDFDETR